MTINIEQPPAEYELTDKNPRCVLKAVFTYYKQFFYVENIILLWKILFYCGKHRKSEILDCLQGRSIVSKRWAQSSELPSGCVHAEGKAESQEQKVKTQKLQLCFNF